MNNWSFVIAAYAFTLLAVGALLLQSFVAMRRSEAEADRLRRHR